MLHLWLSGGMLRGMKPDLTIKQIKFAHEYFKTGQASASYRAVYSVENMSDASISSGAQQLLNNAKVVEYLEQLHDEAAHVAQLSVGWVLKQYMQIATANVNDLIESRRVCCRHCHGIGHAYQWIDQQEWAQAVAHVMEYNADRPRKAAEKPLPDTSGGFGFWATRDPVATCPKCFGEGHQHVHVHDTRRLTGPAKLLYAGVKQTQHGIEIKTRDQDAALDYLAKYLGIDKKTLEVSGPNGGPVRSVSAITSDPVEAARVYADVMQGKP